MFFLDLARRFPAGPQSQPSSGAQTAPASAPSSPAASSPDVRIGITTDPQDVRLFAAGGLLILNPGKLTPAWKTRFEEEVMVVLDLPRGIAPRPVFRVQVGSFASEAEASALKDRLERLIPDPAFVSFNPDRNSYRVRVGEFARREEASELTERLLGEGLTELWVAEEAGPSSGKARLRLVDSRYYSQVTDAKSLLVLSAVPGGTVEVNGQPYRGKMEVRILGDSLKVINQLPLEDYLRGVVPNEMGPGVYPELEALKAQAVAARTYAVANHGQFSDSGYDICDSPACQVYRGFGTEHPLTNQAVEETQGVIATYNGAPIKALYTSTCGGRTEDGGNIFPDLKLPYLKGVDCYPEAAAPSVLAGRTDLPLVETGTSPPLGVELGLLVVSGVAGPDVLRKKYLEGEAEPAEALGWWLRAFGIIGAGSAPAGVRIEKGDLLEWSRFLMKAFDWDERARLALDDRDLPFILDAADASQIPGADARGVAFLLTRGVFGYFPDGTLRIHSRPSRAMMLGWIHRIADDYASLDLSRGTFRGMEEGSMRVGAKGSQEVYPVTPGPYLYRTIGNRTFPSPTLDLAVGSEIRYHLDASRRIDLLILSSGAGGAADDRSSSYYQWQVRYTRQELEDLIRKRVDVGRLADVQATRRGVSGRVIQVKIQGSRGTFTLNGFKIRTALGIRENLFTIERQNDPGGGIRAFTFAGKGWGHGVGLCQVGAYGMALRGETFDRILKHYYPGIDLTRSY